LLPEVTERAFFKLACPNVVVDGVTDVVGAIGGTCAWLLVELPAKEVCLVPIGTCVEYGDAFKSAAAGGGGVVVDDAMIPLISVTDTKNRIINF